MKAFLKDKQGFAAGILAVLFWAVVPALRQLISRDTAMFFSGGFISLSGGCVMLLMRLRAGGYRPLRSVSPRYWLLVALPYLGCSISGTLALGLAKNEQAMLLASLLYSLWPLATILLAVPILGLKTRRGFGASMVLGVLGMVLAAGIGDPASLLQTLRENALCLICGLLSPFCWGVASNFYCIFVHDVRSDFAALYNIADGLVQLLFSVAFGEAVGRISAAAWGGLVFQMLFSTVLATILWNMAMRSRYRLATVVFSNLIPVLSTVLSCLLLRAELTLSMAAGSALVVAATLLADRCMEEQNEEEPANE